MSWFGSSAAAGNRVLGDPQQLSHATVGNFTPNDSSPDTLLGDAEHIRILLQRVVGAFGCWRPPFRVLLVTEIRHALLQIPK